MTKKDQALRYAVKAFLIIAHGGHLLPSEAKTFAELCSVALPVKYRFNAKELGEIKGAVHGWKHKV